MVEQLRIIKNDHYNNGRIEFESVSGMRFTIDAEELAELIAPHLPMGSGLMPHQHATSPIPEGVTGHFPLTGCERPMGNNEKVEVEVTMRYEEREN